MPTEGAAAQAGVVAAAKAPICEALVSACGLLIVLRCLRCHMRLCCRQRGQQRRQPGAGCDVQAAGLDPPLVQRQQRHKSRDLQESCQGLP